MFDRQVIHVEDGRIPTARDLTVLLNRLEDGPALLAVSRVACESEGNEERFNGFWTIKKGDSQGKNGKCEKYEGRTVRCIVRRMEVARLD